jgi:hypothetical protein
MTNHANMPIEEKIKAAAKNVEPAKEFPDMLWQQMTKKKETKRENTRLNWFSRPLQTATLVLAMIALVIVVVGPQKVVTAFSELLGYLPGSGFVENNESTLYLSKPVSVEQDGITLTVQQVVADQNQVVVTYTLNGLPQDANACVYDKNTLKLPDDKIKWPVGGGISGSDAQIYYQPLPEGVKNFSLIVAAQTSDCTGPQNWNVDLTLGPLPAGVTLAPVAQGEDVQASTSMPSSNSTEAVQVQISIDQVAETNDGYVIAGHASSTNPDWNDILITSDSIQVSDANGKNIPIEPADDDVNGSGKFAFKIARGDYAAPLTIQFQSATVTAQVSTNNAFSFDAGEQPSTDQSWTINQTLSLLGHDVTIESVRALHDDSVAANAQTVTGYAIEMKTDTQIVAVSFQGSNSSINGRGSYSSLDSNDNGSIKIETTFPEGVPTGVVTFTADHIVFKLDGNWSMQLNLQK